MPLFLFTFILFFSACHHRVEIVSTPQGAEIYRNNEFVGTTPMEMTHWWVPFKKDEVDIRLIGYRTYPFRLAYPFHRLTLDVLMFRYDVILGFAPVRHTIILQKES